MFAAEVGNYDAVVFLLRAGANPWFHDIRGTHRTAAWYAQVNHPKSGIAELLCEYIAEVEQQNAQASVTDGGPDEDAQMNI